MSGAAEQPERDGIPGIPGKDEIEDIHTHNRQAPAGSVLSLRPAEFLALSEEEVTPRFFSVGFHPWDLAGGEPTEADWQALERAIADPRVVALGECGIDLLKGGPLFRQLNVLRRQVEIAEAAGLPMVMHCVRGHDHIIGMHRDLRPRQNWAIHGFRGRPSIARMLVGEGLYLSFGERFNADSLREVARERILVETDESEMPVTLLASRIGLTDAEAKSNAEKFLERKMH